MPKKKLQPLPKKDPIAAHAELIGRVSMAWNNVQYVIFLLFAQLSGLPPRKAEAVFFALKADSAQRDITLHVGRVALKRKPQLWGRFSTLMNGIKNLAGQRNAATHTMWEVEALSGEVAPTQGIPTSGALQKDFAKQFRELEAELGRYHSDLVALQAAFPQRPALLGKAPPRSAPPVPNPAGSGPRSPSRNRRSRPRSSRR